MWNDVHKQLDALHQQFVESQRHTIQVDFIKYMDELSTLNGNYPHIGMWQTYYTIRICGLVYQWKLKVANGDQSHNSYTGYKIKSWANRYPWIYQGLGQVPRKRKHSLSTLSSKHQYGCRKIITMSTSFIFHFNSLNEHQCRMVYQ